MKDMSNCDDAITQIQTVYWTVYVSDGSLETFGTGAGSETIAPPLLRKSRLEI